MKSLGSKCTNINCEGFWKNLWAATQIKVPSLLPEHLQLWQYLQSATLSSKHFVCDTLLVSLISLTIKYQNKHSLVMFRL